MSVASQDSSKIKIKPISKKKKEIDIYSSTILTKYVSLPIIHVGQNIKETLKNIIVNEIEGKCIAEGFIKQAGEGYAVGDLLEVAEELASVDSFTGISNAAVVKVEEINEEGGVTRISFKNKGKYFLNSDLKEEFFVKGGYGSKAKIMAAFTS